MPDTPAAVVNIESEVVRRIEATEVQPSPFPHMRIDGIFPDNFYAEIRRNIPDRKFYRRITDTGRAKGEAYDARLILHLSRVDVLLPPAQQPFWKSMN